MLNDRYQNGNISTTELEFDYRPGPLSLTSASIPRKLAAITVVSSTSIYPFSVLVSAAVCYFVRFQIHISRMGTVEETYEGEITRRKVKRTSLRIQEVSSNFRLLDVFVVFSAMTDHDVKCCERLDLCEKRVCNELSGERLEDGLGYI